MTATTTPTKGQQKLVDLLALLAEAETAEIEPPDTFGGTFGRYSENNQLAIYLQFPSATDVAGFHAWQDRGRRVRKGQHGIQILAPNAYKTTDDNGVETSEVRGMHLAYVWDITQTEPLDEPPEYQHPEEPE